MAVIDFSFDQNPDFADVYNTQLAMALSSMDETSGWRVRQATDNAKRMAFINYSQSVPTQDLIDTFKAGMGPEGTNSIDPVWIQNALAGRAGMPAVGWHNDSIRDTESWARPTGEQLTPQQIQDIQGIRNYTKDVLQGVDSGTLDPQQYFGGAESTSFNDRNSTSAIGGAARSLGGAINDLKVPLAAAAVIGGGVLAGQALAGAGAGAAGAGGAGLGPAAMFTAPTGVGAEAFGAGSLGAGIGSAGLSAGAGAGAGGGILSTIGAALSGGGAAGGASMPSWLDTALSIGTTGANIYGAYQQNQQQQDVMQALQRSGQLPATTITGPGGVGATLGPGYASFGLGELEPFRQQLLQQAGMFQGQVPGQIPGAVNQSAQAFMQALDQPLVPTWPS